MLQRFLAATVLTVTAKFLATNSNTLALLAATLTGRPSATPGRVTFGISVSKSPPAPVRSTARTARPLQHLHETLVSTAALAELKPGNFLALLAVVATVDDIAIRARSRRVLSLHRQGEPGQLRRRSDDQSVRVAVAHATGA